MQRTISKPLKISGIGLHSGRQCMATLNPAPPDNGRVFILGDRRIKANLSSVIDSNYCTVLGEGEAQVATVEHLLAAAMGLEIDNLDIVVIGEEIPIADGSAKPWVEAILANGIDIQDKSKRYIAPQFKCSFADGNRQIEIEPHVGLRLSINYDIGSQITQNQHGEWDITPELFRHELAWARTFGFRRDLPKLLALNRAQGANLNNCLVFEENGLNPNQYFRGANEPLRHKALDLLGDLALLDQPLSGWIKARQPGHALTTRALETWNLKPLDSNDKLR